jgi:hypothetical protein
MESFMSHPLSTRCFVPLAILTTICFLAVVAPRLVFATAAERWVCEIELHQRNTGRLVMNRTANDIDGSLTLRPGADTAPATTAIKGSWSADTIRFTRTVPPTGEQPYIGIAVATGPRASKMAGRFAADYSGVWSATCSVETEGPVVPDPPVPPAPKPTESRTCTISGSATGPRASLAKAYQVLLRGPNSLTRVAGRQPFGSGQFSFTNLAEGSYLLTIDTKADVSVQIAPRSHQIACSGGSIAGKNFDFR